MSNENLVKIKDVNLNRLFASSNNPIDSLDIDFTFAIYQGSLTSPPCDEIVKMVVHMNALPIKYTTLKQLSFYLLPDHPEAEYMEQISKVMRYKYSGTNRYIQYDFNKADDDEDSRSNGTGSGKLKGAGSNSSGSDSDSSNGGKNGKNPKRSISFHETND